MGKINKFANLYSRDGKKIRSVNDKGVLTNVSIEELENLIDNFEGDKNSMEYYNLQSSLIAMYNKYGNPHKEELLAKLQEYATKKSTEEMVNDKLNEIVKDLNGDIDIDGDVDMSKNETIMDEYVDFQEVREAA